MREEWRLACSLRTLSAALSYLESDRPSHLHPTHLLSQSTKPGKKDANPRPDASRHISSPTTFCQSNISTTPLRLSVPISRVPWHHIVAPIANFNQYQYPISTATSFRDAKRSCRSKTKSIVPPKLPSLSRPSKVSSHGFRVFPRLTLHDQGPGNWHGTKTTFSTFSCDTSQS